jgi:hypothetical protein
VLFSCVEILKPLFSLRLQVVFEIIKFYKFKYDDIMNRLDNILYELINVLEDLEAK